MNSHQEFEQQTFQALVNAAKGISDEELNILCYHCGINASDIRKELAK